MGRHKERSVTKAGRIMIVAFAVLFCAACVKEHSGMCSYPVSVGVAEIKGVGDTKATVDAGNKIHWSKGDKLGLLAVATDGNAALAELTLNNVDAGLMTGKFQGSVNIASVPDKCYFVYPSVVGLSCSGNAVSATFSYEGQTGEHVPYLYSDAVNYSSAGINCTMHHLGGMLRITLPSNTVKSIRVQGNNGEKLTPYIYNATALSGNATGEAAASFTVNPAGNTGICYIAMPPVNFTKGFSLVFRDNQDAVMYKSFNADTGYDFSQNKGVLIDIDVTSFIPFNLNVEANIAHLFNGEGNLYASKIELNSAALQGAPAKILDGWGAELYNNSNTLVRSVQSSVDPAGISSSNTLPLTEISGGVYLPQGTYTLKPYIIIHNVKVYAPDKSMVVPAPQLTMTSGVLTSYSYYQAGNITGANNSDGSTIYSPAGTCKINIAPELISAYGASASYTLDGTISGVAMSGNALNLPEQFSNQSWAAHTFSANVTFDGTTYTSQQTVQVTGLPYNATPPTNSGDHSWSKINGNSVAWESSYVQLKTSAIPAPKIATPYFHIPANLNVAVSFKAAMNGYSGYNVSIMPFDVNGNDGTKCVDENIGKSSTMEKTVDSAMDQPYTRFAFYFGGTTVFPVLKVYYFRINYR